MNNTFYLDQWSKLLEAERQYRQRSDSNYLHILKLIRLANQKHKTNDQYNKDHIETEIATIELEQVELDNEIKQINCQLNQIRPMLIIENKRNNSNDNRQ